MASCGVIGIVIVVILFVPALALMIHLIVKLSKKRKNPEDKSHESGLHEPTDSTTLTTDSTTPTTDSTTPTTESDAVDPKTGTPNQRQPSPLGGTRSQLQRQPSPDRQDSQPRRQPSPPDRKDSESSTGRIHSQTGRILSRVRRIHGNHGRSLLPMRKLRKLLPVNQTRKSNLRKGQKVNVIHQDLQDELEDMVHVKMQIKQTDRKDWVHWRKQVIRTRMDNHDQANQALDSRDREQTSSKSLQDPIKLEDQAKVEKVSQAGEQSQGEPRPQGELVIRILWKMITKGLRGRKVLLVVEKSPPRRQPSLLAGRAHHLVDSHLHRERRKSPKRGKQGQRGPSGPRSTKSAAFRSSDPVRIS